MVAASEQPASRSGSRTFFCGLRMDAVSAMKCTPQKTITLGRGGRGLRDRPSESPTKSAMSCTSGPLIVVGQDDRVALLFQALNLPGQHIGRGRAVHTALH
jgi:hypothetical protein